MVMGMAIVSLLLSFIFILYGKFFDFEHNNSRRPPLLQAEGQEKTGEHAGGRFTGAPVFGQERFALSSKQKKSGAQPPPGDLF